MLLVAQSPVCLQNYPCIYNIDALVLTLKDPRYASLDLTVISNIVLDTVAEVDTLTRIQ